MNVGDLVILRKGGYKFTPTSKGKWIFHDTLGVITDIRRPPGSWASDEYREYKIFTSDGKHMWEHENDLRPTGDESADPLGRERDDDETR